MGCACFVSERRPVLIARIRSQNLASPVSMVIPTSVSNRAERFGGPLRSWRPDAKYCLRYCLQAWSKPVSHEVVHLRVHLDKRSLQSEEHVAQKAYRQKNICNTS
eukprot:5663367-Amphidinium_carterae.1